MRTRHEEPAPAEQLAAAMGALGFYTGTHDPGQHAGDAMRLGGADAYRMRLVNALLGAVQTEPILDETVEAARSSLLDAVANVDILRRMSALADALVRER